MKITLYQQNIEWLDTEANYRKIEQVLISEPETDLLVLPEMCTTGFVTMPQPGQLQAAAVVEEKLKCLATQYRTAICGSFAVIDNEGNNRNRAFFVKPAPQEPALNEANNQVYFADKHHLFAPGGESLVYTKGNERAIAEYMGVRFLLLICYDLRFPVWARYSENNQYDMIVYMANWPAQRQLAWQTLLPARAIENQAFVIGVNRVGTDNICPYQGGTCAIHPYGHIVAACSDNTEEYVTFEPDLQKLHEFRQKFPVGIDSDSFILRP